MRLLCIHVARHNVHIRANCWAELHWELIMLFTFIQNGSPVPMASGAYSMRYTDILAANPTIGLTHDPVIWETLDVRYLGYFPLTQTTPPSYNAATQAAPIETAPIQVNNVWTQQWQSPADLSVAQLEALVPQQVTAAQMMIALSQQPYYATVTSYVATLPIADQLAFNRTDVFNRQDVLILSLSPNCGLTSAQLDALFVAASEVAV